jgi:hypothetical protein
MCEIIWTLIMIQLCLTEPQTDPAAASPNPFLLTWMLIMSLLLLSGMSMGASTVLRPSGSAWNWLRVVALPS